MSTFPYGLKPGRSYNLTLTTASAATQNPISAGVRMLRLLQASGSARVALGVAPVASANATCMLLIASVPEYIQCSGSGTEKIAGILGTGTSTLNITEMTQ